MVLANAPGLSLLATICFFLSVSLVLLPLSCFSARLCGERSDSILDCLAIKGIFFLVLLFWIAWQLKVSSFWVCCFGLLGNQKYLLSGFAVLDRSAIRSIWAGKWKAPCVRRQLVRSRHIEKLSIELQLQLPLFLGLLQHHWAPDFLRHHFFAYSLLEKKNGGRLQSGSCPRPRGHSLKRRLASKISGTPRAKKNGRTIMESTCCGVFFFVLLSLCFTTTRFFIFLHVENAPSTVLPKISTYAENRRKYHPYFEKYFSKSPTYSEKSKNLQKKLFVAFLIFKIFKIKKK